MSAEDRFDSVVENLYRASVGDVPWVWAATLINEFIRTSGHSVTYFETSRGGQRPRIHWSRFFVGAERRPDLEQSYFSSFYPRDEAVPRLVGLRDCELVHKSDLYTDQEKKTSSAYNQYYRLYDAQDALYMGIDGPGDCDMIMCFVNSTEHGGWGHDQIKAIRRLAPHMRHFVRVRRALADATATSATLVNLFDNRQLGLIQLDRAGRILEANDRARDVLLKGDGLCDRGGELAARQKEEDRELRRLLAGAVPPFGDQGAGDFLKITRRKAAAPLILELHPARHMAAVTDSRQLGALVLIIDPANRPRIDPGLVADLLGLTPTESRVAVAIAAGQTVAGTAHELGCAEGTARTHLKRIYRKLGIRKQTELVRKVLLLGS